MRRTYLKIPTKLHLFCKDKNCVNEVVTYYQLKIVNSNGYFPGTTLIHKMLSEKISKSESSCYYKLRKCISTGLVKKTAYGYQLVSYDDMFELLGYNMTYYNKRKRKGFFKIHKIREDNIAEVKNWIQYVDIRDSLRKQRILLFKSLKNSKTHSVPLDHYTISSCKEKLDELVSRDPVKFYSSFKDDLNTYIYTLQTGKKFKRELNLDITLSLKGVCRVLGLTNVSSARLILERLSKNKFLKVESRIIPTSHLHPDIYYKNINNQLHAILCNKIDYLV